MSHYTSSPLSGLAFAPVIDPCAFQIPSNSTDFPLGSSSLYRHETSQHHSALSYPNATGLSPSSSGYHYSTSGILPQPVFSYSPPPFDPDPLPSDNSYIHKQDWFPHSASHLLTAPFKLPEHNHLNISFRNMAIQSAYGAPTPSPENIPALLSHPQNIPTSSQPAQSRFPPTTTSSPSSGPMPKPPQADLTSDGKEKRHHCWMCYKSFDRPSTLRKHLLVHTGEKAYKCDTCGRRFSVASNLSRHVKRCALRPVHGGPTRAPGSAPPTSSASPDPHQPPSSSSSSGTSLTTTTGTTNATGNTDTSTTVSSSEFRNEFVAVQPNLNTSPSARSNKRRRTSSTSDPASPSGTSSSQLASTEPQPPKPRRRRRVPQPTLWIPESLKLFDFTPLLKPTPVPLPPVHPYTDPVTRILYEERDSYNESLNDTERPYHNEGWKGVLPGPAIVKPEVGCVGGTLLVF